MLSVSGSPWIADVRCWTFPLSSGLRGAEVTLVAVQKERGLWDEKANVDRWQSLHVDLLMSLLCYIILLLLYSLLYLTYILRCDCLYEWAKWSSQSIPISKSIDFNDQCSTEGFLQTLSRTFGLGEGVEGSVGGVQTHSNCSKNKTVNVLTSNETVIIPKI